MSPQSPISSFTMSNLIQTLDTKTNRLHLLDSSLTILKNAMQNNYTYDVHVLNDLTSTCGHTVTLGYIDVNHPNKTVSLLPILLNVPSTVPAEVIEAALVFNQESLTLGMNMIPNYYRDAAKKTKKSKSRQRK